MLCFVAAAEQHCGLKGSYCGISRLSTVEGKKGRKAVERRSTRAAQGDVSLAKLSVPVGRPARLCDVWPRSIFLSDPRISLTFTFDVQSSLTPPLSGGENPNSPLQECAEQSGAPADARPSITPSHWETIRHSGERRTSGSGGGSSVPPGGAAEHEQNMLLPRNLHQNQRFLSSSCWENM